jgi:type II secretory ATPase GspE/PulE/Tfp pilus assembly ATPase PilB-like protein
MMAPDGSVIVATAPDAQLDAPEDIAFAYPRRISSQAVVSRGKLLAELDISERRRPQDGCIRVRLETRELDLRVSTVPTMYGESVVRASHADPRTLATEQGMIPLRLDGFDKAERGITTIEGVLRVAHE